MFTIYGPTSIYSTTANASTSDMFINSSEDSVQYIEPENLPRVTITPQLSCQEEYPSDKENRLSRTTHLQFTRWDNISNLSDTDRIYDLECPVPTPALVDPRPKPLEVRYERLEHIHYD